MAKTASSHRSPRTSESAAQCATVVLAYRGPFVPNALTRPEGVAPDPKALETLGVGEGEKYFEG